MNIYDPRDVITTMCMVSHDANAISISVEHETIIIKADLFQMRLDYPGYGNHRVQQLAKPYQHVLDKVQREENDVASRSPF